MFGYVVVNRRKLSDEQFHVYHSFYCGLCFELRESYGKSMAVFLNYDMAFLAMVLSGLYEPETEQYEKKCPVHLTRKETIRRNACTAYAKDMTILLSYYKVLDDIQDENKGRLLLKKLSRPMNQIREKYPKKVNEVECALKKTQALEKKNCQDVDLLCNASGELLGPLFASQDGPFQKELYGMGYALGKFIYLMDAYDDLEKDQKNGCFNPLTHMDRKEIDDKIESWLEVYLSEAADCFERMPILDYSDIIRNILYSGVWTRLEEIKETKRNESL